MKTKGKPTRGGARPGAGRKPTGVAPFHCYPKRETIAELRSRSRTTKRTLGQLIDAMTAKNHAKIFKAE